MRARTALSFGSSTPSWSESNLVARKYSLQRAREQATHAQSTHAGMTPPLLELILDSIIIMHVAALDVNG